MIDTKEMLKKDINRMIVENRNNLNSKEIVELMEELLIIYQSELEIFGEVK
jgi:hypothetical protein